MKQVNIYEKELMNISPRKWEAFLIQNSGLPGPRANIDLAKAFARTGTLLDFKKFIFLNPTEAPENTPPCFLVMCGIMGVGNYLSQYEDEGLLNRLQQLANDPRRRVRKAVTIALQLIGKKKGNDLLSMVKPWINGSYYEQQCLVTALAEPDFLRSKETAGDVLHILDLVTVHLVDPENESDGFRQLKRSLGYCWSIVVAVSPRKGRKLMERWIKEDRLHINDVMNENLKRLHQIDPTWTDTQLSKIKW